MSSVNSASNGELNQQNTNLKKLLLVVKPEDENQVRAEIIKCQDELMTRYIARINKLATAPGQPGNPTTDIMGQATIEQPTFSLNPDGESRACSCGARHTSNPKHHMTYCDLYTVR